MTAPSVHTHRVTLPGYWPYHSNPETLPCADPNCRELRLEAALERLGPDWDPWAFRTHLDECGHVTAKPNDHTCSEVAEYRDVIRGLQIEARRALTPVSEEGGR